MSTKKAFEIFSENLLNISSMYPKIWGDYCNKISNHYQEYSQFNFFKIFDDFMKNVNTNHETIMKMNEEWYNKHMSIINNVLDKAKGIESEPLYKTDPKDNRFTDPAWDKNIYFDYIKQTYIMTSEWMNNIAAKNDNFDDRTKRRFNFYLKNIIDAMSPSNFIHTNPAIIRSVIDSNAENLLSGLEKLYNDVVSVEVPNITTVDMNAFQVGKDLAATEGVVIHKDKLSELIYYYPKQQEVNAIPILIIPPCINKYYILDLQQKNSMVNWLLDQGHQVMILSWVNPDASYRDTNFQDYLMNIFNKIEFIQNSLNIEKISLAGYCIGGTITVALLAYLSALGKADIIASTLLMTTLIDFSDPGDIEVFLDEEQVAIMEQKMERLGYHDNHDMSMTFNLLRAKDMIWSNIVNNYLLGKSPIAFDILYWNADSTRIPKAMHSFYIRNMYLENNLIKPRGIKINDIDLDISKINTPIYFLAAKDDHIVPWYSVYDGLKYIKNAQFVLSESGHVGSIVNPPSRNKYGFYIGKDTTHDSNSWLEKASYNNYSWWVDYSSWQNSFSKNKIKPIDDLQIKKYAIETAPGQYIFMK